MTFLFFCDNYKIITKNYADYGGGVCVGSDGYAKNCDFTMFNGNITYKNGITSYGYIYTDEGLKFLRINEDYYIIDV